MREDERGGLEENISEGRVEEARLNKSTEALVVSWHEHYQIFTSLLGKTPPREGRGIIRGSGITVVVLSSVHHLL